jgi:hypothetical protein
MRRVLASLLLAIISLSLLTPVLLANASSELPACCRRFGKHHCSMPSSPSPAGGVAINASCPFQSHAPVLPANDHQLWFVQSLASGYIAHQNACVDLPRTSPRNPREFSVQSERGPPSCS